MSLKSRWQSLRSRAIRAAAAFLEKPEAASESPLAALDLATEQRIFAEYEDALDKFVAQRDQWRDMFAEWRAHLVAQRMLTRALKTGRGEVASLALLCANSGAEVPVTKVVLPAFCTLGTPPESAADDYERVMLKIIRAHPEPKQAPRLASLKERAELEKHLRRGDDEAEAYHFANGELLSVIRAIEVERDAWKDHVLFQKREHATNQGNLQIAIESVSEVHKMLLGKLNALRAEEKLTPIVTRADLAKLLPESAS
jgi:hypothetical protein